MEFAAAIDISYRSIAVIIIVKQQVWANRYDIRPATYKNTFYIVRLMEFAAAIDISYRGIAVIIIVKQYVTTCRCDRWYQIDKHEEYR